ncbi:stage II sporulation protein M [Pleionea sediminis]|uniref:stage II sporulation protein M n=1 Tax=Pleionea sediminis TaxID=2569479 RepID=UPI001184ADAF|nr:stage II sporulation protein M [Pleionea sediminis]
MRQEEFEKQYTSIWQESEQLFNQFDSRSERKKLDQETLNQLPNLYRALCHSLAIAKERQYSPYLIEYLDNLVLRGHQILYSKRTYLLYKIIHFVAHGFPSEIQKQKLLFWMSMLIFFGPSLILLTLTILNPDLVYSIVPPNQVSQIESMYDPEASVLGRERESDSDFYMFGHYIWNNIGIGFRTFATGILFTMGSIFFLTFNGLFFGAISAHIINIKYTSTFFPFVIGHGSFELTAIVICGMAGIKLGWSIIAPGNLTRLDSLKLATEKAVLLVYGAALFLLIAAFIEAFWSSSTLLTTTTKYSVGTFLWIFVYVYLLWPRKLVSK